MGEKIDELEIELKNFTGLNNSLPVPGTDALFLLLAIDIKPEMR